MGHRRRPPPPTTTTTYKYTIRSPMSRRSRTHWLHSLRWMLISTPLRHHLPMRSIRAFLQRSYVRTLLPAAVALGIFFSILRISGLHEYFFEKDFTHFKWLPNIDVHRQVVRELTGESSEFIYTNDWNDYEPLLRPTCKNNWLTRKQSLLVVVKSAPSRTRYRQTIRETWGTVREEGGFRLRTVFVMGVEGGGGEGLSEAMRTEAEQYGDMLVGNFTDHYHSNTLKFLIAIDLARNYCSPDSVVPYVFLVDDDYVVSVRNLVMEASRHAPNERLYMGWRWETPAPFRFRFHKHRISLDQYSFNRYPHYITAGAVLLTAETVKEFHSAIQFTQLFIFDDVYAGILAHLIGIVPRHSENFSYNYPPTDDEALARFWKYAVATHTQEPWREAERYSRAMSVGGGAGGGAGGGGGGGEAAFRG